MTSIIKLPEGFEPPTEVVRENYTLEALSPKHNEMDFEAWDSSREELRGIFGPRNDWPQNVTSLDQNLKDLEEHYNEFITKEAFTYTILSTDRKSCIGCLYIRPIPTSDYDCRVNFWFRNSHKHLEAAFFNDVKSWLKNDWEFVNIAFTGRIMPWDEYYKLID